ncbi:hypothetical protein D3C74_440760 [compost metagenome]
MLCAQHVFLLGILRMNNLPPPAMALIDLTPFVAQQLVPAVREIVDHRGHIYIPDHRIGAISRQTEALIAYFQIASHPFHQLHIEQ